MVCSAENVYVKDAMCCEDISLGQVFYYAFGKR